MAKGTRIAFFMATLGTGGIGKMRVHLTRELIKRGVEVDLLLGDSSGPYVQEIDPRVQLITIGTSHSWHSIPRVIRYLHGFRPEAIVTEKLRVNIAVQRSVRLSRMRTPVYASVHGVLSHKLYQEGLSERKIVNKLRAIRRYYPQNAGFLPVSKAIGDDLVANFQIDPERVHVVYNPVVTPELLALARSAPDHPWLRDRVSPVIVSVGRLEPQKDYETLIRAFSILQAQHPSRLIIAGAGIERPRLEALVRQLSLDDLVSLPGFVANPYCIMGQGDLFVLSSRWEGFGNVLVEAMATGTPVIAMDCPGGPREILDAGRLGALVPVGDERALAEAMAATLRKPVSASRLQAAAGAYSASACAEGYLKALGLS